MVPVPGWRTGIRPRLYSALNSHGSWTLRHEGHGHVPVHLIFLLLGVSSATTVGWDCRAAGLKAIA